MKQQKILINNWILTVTVVFMVMFACNSAMAERTWTVGSVIDTPIISGPSSGDKFGLATRVECTCDTPTDSDDWCDPEIPDSGSEDDLAIKATWSDNGAGGSWVGDVNEGESVTYITPSNTGSVTLKVTFDDDGTEQYDDTFKDASVTIAVFDAKMIFKVSSVETSAIDRTASGSFEVVDGNGDIITGAAYASWAFDGEVDASNATHSDQTWSGTIVEPGKASCNVTFGGDTVEVSKSITVNPRDWSLTPTFSPDTDSNWGDYPYLGGDDENHGVNGSAISGEGNVLDPLDPDDGNGFVILVIHDRGPNDLVCYISSTTLVSSHESLINKFLRSGTTGYPDPPNINWHEFNEASPRNVNADDYLQAVKNHEAYGTGSNRNGHQAFLEDEEAKLGNDARTEIEDNVGSVIATLESETQSEIATIEAAIDDKYDDEPTGNWSGNVWDCWPSTGWAEVNMEI